MYYKSVEENGSLRLLLFYNPFLEQVVDARLTVAEDISHYFFGMFSPEGRTCSDFGRGLGKPERGIEELYFAQFGMLDFC